MKRTGDEQRIDSAWVVALLVLWAIGIGWAHHAGVWPAHREGIWSR